MRYLLVDRIVDWQQGESIKGIKNIAMSEDFLEFHFPKAPVMPGALLLEALVQLAGWLEAVSSDFQRWFLLEQVDRCMYYGVTLPGDMVELEIKKQSGALGRERYGGVCSVNGKKAVVAEFAGATVPLADIENVDDQKRFFQILSRSLK